MRSSDPARPRRVIITLAACQVWRLRWMVQAVNEWFARFFKLASLTILPLPGVAGHRVQAVMVWELPPSLAATPLRDIERDVFEDQRDLWRCEDYTVNEGV